MKTKFLSLLLVTAMLLSLLTGMTVMADEVTIRGEGTDANPYRIATAEELVYFANLSNGADYAKYAGTVSSGYVYYLIEADIDMTGIDFPGFCKESLGNSFYGFISGAGHVISNLTIAGEEGYAQGLVCLGNKCRITDLGLKNVTINAGTDAAAFVGQSSAVHQVNSVHIQSCFVDGVTFASAVKGKTGAFIGDHPKTDGYNQLANCYSMNISGNSATYGFIGWNGTSGAPVNMYNCWTTGDSLVSGSREAKSVYKQVTASSYVPATVNSETAKTVWGDSVSGVLTADAFTATPAYTATSKYTPSVIGFVDDKYAITADGLPVLQWQTTDLYEVTGKGTADSPYEIATAEDLMYFASQSNSTDNDTNIKFSGNLSDSKKVYYKITADIDMTGKAFPGFGRADIAPSVTNLGDYGEGFYGEVYGGGHVISNLTIQGTAGNPTGFLCQARDAVITDLGLENVTISNGKYVGAFIGHEQRGTSTIQSCYVDGLTYEGTVSNNAAFVGRQNGAYTSPVFINCYSLNVEKGNGFLSYDDSMGVCAQLTNCYTSRGHNNVSQNLNKNCSATNAYKLVTETSYQTLVMATETSETVSAKLTADKLNAELTKQKIGTHILTNIGFVADEFDINDGFPVLAWQNEGRVKDVEPGFVADSTTVIEAADDVDGCPSFIVYGWLNNFNTDATGMEYGMKISDGDGWEEYLPACRKVEDGENITYVPATPVANGQFAIRVYITGLTSSATYTMTPYIGAEGNYSYGDTSDGYTVGAE